MESTDRVRGDTTRLYPSVDASLTEQNVALTTRVDLILNVEVAAREIHGGFDDRRGFKRGAVQVHTGYADLHLGELGHRIKREDVPGRRGGNTFHHFPERFP